MILLFALLLQPQYVLNGKTYAERAEMASAPQCGRITIEAVDRPAAEIAAEVSRQAGFLLKWDGPVDAKAGLSAKNAPFVAVVAELARSMKAAFEEFQSSDGPFVQIPGAFVKAPVVAWHADGPLVVTWHGLADRAKSPFAEKDAGRPPKHFQMRLWQDPRCHAIKLPEAAPRDQTVTFSLDGKKHVLKSDHDPAVFSSSGPTWQFDPRPELAGESADVEVSVPVHLPSRTTRGELDWKKGASSTFSDVTLTVESVKTGRKKVPDPKDSFKETEVVEAVAVVFLRHVDGALYDEIVKSGRNPTEAEGERLRKLQEGGGAMALHEALAGSIPARVKRASGISSPVHGYRFEVSIRSSDLSFSPGKVVLVWADAYRRLEASFRISGALLK